MIDETVTAPTAERVATAWRLRELHRRRPDPFESICEWCLKPWPCADERWATRILRLKADARHQGRLSHPRGVAQDLS